MHTHRFLGRVRIPRSDRVQNHAVVGDQFIAAAFIEGLRPKIGPFLFYTHGLDELE